MLLVPLNSVKFLNHSIRLIWSFYPWHIGLDDTAIYLIRTDRLRWTKCSMKSTFNEPFDVNKILNPPLNHVGYSYLVDIGQYDMIEKIKSINNFNYFD